MGGGRGGPSDRDPAAAQQRPLVTEDPEVIGAGLILLEGGFDYSRDILFPLSGLQGNLLRAPTLGVSVGISSIAELQIDGGLYNRLNVTHRGVGPAPLASQLNFTGDTTHAVEDIVVATKIRIVGRDAGSSGVRPPFRDEAAERGQRERPRPRHDRLPCAGARRQDRAIGPGRGEYSGWASSATRPAATIRTTSSITASPWRGRCGKASRSSGELNGRAARAAARRRSAPKAARRCASADASPAARCASTPGILLGVTSRDPGFGFHRGRHLRVQGIHGPVAWPKACFWYSYAP